MKGAWSTFGIDQLPSDGEAIVIVIATNASGTPFDQHQGRVVPVIYRGGYLTDQDGAMMAVWHGLEWTALPPGRLKAPR